MGTSSTRARKFQSRNQGLEVRAKEAASSRLYASRTLLSRRRSRASRPMAGRRRAYQAKTVTVFPIPQGQVAAFTSRRHRARDAARMRRLRAVVL